MMAKPSITDKMVVIGIIGIGLYLFMMYTIAIPFRINTSEGIGGQIWLAWIVISGLLLGIGILVKIINSRRTS
jgi:hypothetical protein